MVAVLVQWSSAWIHVQCRGTGHEGWWAKGLQVQSSMPLEDGQLQGKEAPPVVKPYETAPAAALQRLSHECHQRSQYDRNKVQSWTSDTSRISMQSVPPFCTDVAEAVPMYRLLCHKSGQYDQMAKKATRQPQAKAATPENTRTTSCKQLPVVTFHNRLNHTPKL